MEVAPVRARDALCVSGIHAPLHPDAVFGFTGEVHVPGGEEIPEGVQDDAKRRIPGYAEQGCTYPATEKIGDNFVSGTYSEAALSFDIYDVIRDYKNDVLLIHGTADPVVPFAYSERAAQTYENARLEVIEGAGRGFYFGEPFERAAELTAAFLRGER